MIRRPGLPDLGAHLRRRARAGREADLILMPLLDRHLAMADLGVPHVLALVADVQAIRALFDHGIARRWRCERARPRQALAVFERARLEEIPAGRGRSRRSPAPHARADRG